MWADRRSLRCGVICGNYGLRSHQGKMWNGAWHGKCFKQHTLDRYPVLSRQDVEDSLVDESKCEDDDPLQFDSIRFKEARDGDHLITPFQCVECHFVNIQGRLPDSQLQCDHSFGGDSHHPCDSILDSLWSTEWSMVYANRLQGLKYVDELMDLGVEAAAYPARGPFPKEDHWGMVVACAMLGRSTAPGRNETQLLSSTKQFGKWDRTIQISHIHTCSDGLGSVFLSDNGSGSTIDDRRSHFRRPTTLPWLKRFGAGAHRRMGDDLKQAFPLTAVANFESVFRPVGRKMGGLQERCRRTTKQGLPSRRMRACSFQHTTPHY